MTPTLRSSRLPFAALWTQALNDARYRVNKFAMKPLQTRYEPYPDERSTLQVLGGYVFVLLPVVVVGLFNGSLSHLLAGPD